MATINDVYSLACNAGYIDANEFSEQAFGDMLKDKNNRRTYYEHVKKLDPNFYSRDYDTFSANVDRMLGMSGSQQSAGRVAGSNPSVKDNPAPTNAQEYQANLQNQWSGAENNFNIPEPNDKPYSEWRDVELRAAHQRMVDEGERVRQQREQQIKDETDERKQWSKEHPVRAFFRDGFNSPDQNRYIAETALESDDARTFVSDKERLRGIEDELGRRAKDSVIPQAKESTRQSEEMTAKVRENSQDFSMHQKANIGAAEYLNTKANEILNAGSKFDDSKAMANWWEGLKNDLDRDVSGIMGAQRAGRISGIVTKLNKGEELTDDEAALLNAYINLAAATEARQFDLSTAYQIGQGTAQSVPFMVDMILTHGGGALAKRGVIKALAKTGSKHIATAAKWLQVPENVVAAELKAAGRDVGQLAETTAKRTFKEAAKDFGRKAVYETIATPAQTVLMPSSWEMMLDEAAQTKLQTGKSELSFLDKARIFTNAAQETLTERAGGELIDWGLGRAFGAGAKMWHFGGKGQNAITKYIQSPIGETAEEYLGALLSLFRSYNPLYDDESNQQLRDEADEMFTAEGLGKTFGTVLPMSLVGGAVNMGELRYRTREMDKARGEIIRQLTSFCGASEEEAQQIMDYTEGASTAKEFAERLDIVGTHLYNAYENMGYDMEKRNEKGDREGMGVALRQSLNDYAEQAAKMNGIVEQFSDRYDKLSDEEKVQAKQALEQVQEQNMQHAAREMAEEDVRDITNKSNNYLYCVGFADGMFPDADEAYIVSGNVAVKHNEYGMPVFDKDASEDQVVAVRIIYEDKTSEVKQLSINDLDLFGEPQSAPEWVDELTNRIYQEMLTTREAQKQAAQQNAQETQPGTQPGQAKPTAQGNAVQQQTTHESVTPIATYRKDGKEIAVVSEKNGVATLSEPISVGENESIHVPTSMLDGLMQQLGYEKAAAAQNQPQSISGTPLSTEQADAMIGQMEQSAEQAPQLELTPENWISQFGEDGIVETPIGKVKMGENQFIKLFSKKRGEYFGMIRPTLNNPDVILEETDPKDGAERDSKYLFIKSFVKSDGSRIIHFESVTVRKDGLEVSISSHELNDTAAKNKMQNDKILHLNEKLSLSSEWRLTKTPGNEERPDLVPTSDISSERKGTENNPNTQENPQKNVPFAENLAAAPRDKMGRVDYRAIKTSDELAKVVTAEMKGNKDDAKDFITMKKKAAEKAKKSLKHKSNEDSAAFLEVRKKEKELQALVSMWDNALTSLRTIRTAEEQAAYDAEQAQKQAEREARKQVQAGTSDGSMASRYASAPKIDGNAGTITAANGQVLKGHYVLVSADGLTPSHDARNGFEMTAGYPTVDGHSINDRDYKNDPEEQAKVRQVAQQYNGNAIKNMPIVSDEGLVYNGNGRIMAGQLAAQQGTDGAYRQALEDNAAQFGFTPEQVVSVPNARVVFQTEERLPYNTTTLAMFNATEQQAQSNTSKAAANTRKLTPEAVGHIINAISGFENTDAFFTDKKAPFNLIDLLIKDGILSDRDKASLIDGNRLSGAGKDVLTSLLFGTAFDEQTIRLLADSPQVQNSVMRALPQIIENKGLGELSLFDHINNAIAAIYDMREKGMSFYEYTHQTDIYGATAKDNFSAFELLLADEMMSSGVSAFRDVLTMYNERARQENGGQSSMLGETVTRENIENEIVEYYKKLKDEQRKQKQSERGQGSASTQSAVASTQGSDVGRRGNAENARDNGRRQQGDLAEIQPIGVSDFGDVFDAFIGKPAEAIAFLKKRKSGEAIGALYHPEIGDIDLVWGYEGTGRSDGFGLAKLVKYHPEVVSNLQGILSEMVISSRSDTRIQLESSKYKAAIRLTWDGEKKTWLLTAFEKESSVFDKTTDTTETINGKQDDTALPQNTASSAHKGTKKSATDQTKSQKNAENLQNAKHNAQSEDKKEENNPTQTPIPGAKKVNVEGLFSDLYANGETKLSDHAEDVLSEQATTEHNTLKSQFADNKVFTENMVEAARRRIHEKLNRLNAGLDPEMFTDGAIIAGAYVESGVRKFTDFAKRMIGEFGDKIRPYLKAFYNGLRDMPEAAELSKEMDDYATVSGIDVNTIEAKQNTDTNLMTDVNTNDIEFVRSKIGKTYRSKNEHAYTLVVQSVSDDGTCVISHSGIDNGESHKTYVAEIADALQSDRYEEVQEPIQTENMTRAEVAAEIAKRNKKSKASKAKTKQEEGTLNMFGNERQSNTELTEENLHGGQKVLLKDGSVATVMMVSRAGAVTPYGAEKPHISSIYLTDGREIQFSDISAINPTETTDTDSYSTKRSAESVEISKNDRDNISARQSDGKPQKRNTRNNHVERGVDYAPKSTAERIKANIAAIKLLKQLQDEGRQASEQDKEVLRKFTGWGGLGEAFKGEPGTTYYSYGGEKSPYQQLQDILTPEELESAQLSRNSAYYTPANVIDALWDVAVKCGFRGGNVLEGSAGIGEILARIPSNANAQSNITAVEIDPITGGILQQLYPDADVHIDGFQNVNIPNNSQDLVITNVPFVRDLHVTDKVEKDITKKFGNSIQDFCIAKNILKLRKGGIGIFIAGKSSMDSSKKLRAWIVGEAGCDVVGAFRLNKDTFGGTGATADIIVVKKRANGIQPSTLSETFVSAPAVSKTEVEVDKKWNSKTYDYDVIKKKAILSYNALYQQHPEWMGGEMRIGADEGDTRFGGTSSACYPKSHIDQQRRLADWAKSLQVGIEDVPQTPLEQVIEQAYTNDWEKLPKEKYENLRLYTLMPNSKGEICRLRGSGYLEPISNNNKVKGDTKEQVLKGYNRIKQAISDVLSAQTNSTDDKQLKKAQAELNAAYDVFVSKYGQLNKNVAIAFLRNDIDFSSVAAIEQYEEIATPEGKQIKTSKTDIFSKRVVGVKPEIKPTNITDAIVLSMQQFGGIHTEDIAKWLGKRTDDVVREIVDSRLGFEDPQTGQLQVRHVYLSGNVREKLRYAQENNEGRRYNTNIEELQKVIPQDIPAHLIGFSIGSTWFGEDLFNEFLREKYALDHKVRHIGGAWVNINENWGKRNEKNRAAGVYSQMLGIQIYGSDLFLAAMNNTPIAVQKKHVNSDNKTETITDKVASQACATRIDEIKDEFTQWARDKMQQNPDLAERMERLYNERFNAIVPMEIDSRFTTPYLSGMNPNVSPLYDIQQKAVVRATMQPTLFAHEVGTGKTRSLICSAMEMRRLGTAKKPMIVVQNATVMQFVEEAKNLYPNAKVLTVNYKDRTPEGRKFFYSKIKYNDWDIIIVPQSVFNMMPDSDERKRDFIQAKIEEKEHAYHAAQEAGVDKNTLGKFLKELGRLQDDYAELNLSGKTKDKKEKKGDEKKAAVRRENAKQAAEKMVDRRTDNVENFDDMGIDALLVDEAHNYKHLGFSTMMQRGVKGIDPRYSERGVSLYLKCQAVFEKTGHKNVVFATGTPISNTAAEVWTFMKYLIPEDVMRENEIYYFDDFVRNFGKINQSLEFATNGKFKENTRFASYMNIPELARLWGIITDTRLSDEVKTASGNSLKEEKIPLMENGKPTDIFLEQSRSLVSIMNAVRAQLEKFENMSGAEKRANTSLPLTMYGIAKRAAIDPRLVDDSAVDEAESKTNKTVEETLKALDDSKDYKGTVAIFCDNYRRQDIDEQTNKKKVGFNIYDEIQHKLVKAGVPSEQIAIMQPKMTDTAKQKVFDAVNDGEIRVVLGSTETLGTGVNIQTRLFTLIHMDAPDRPMDMTQREGRILRQGNMHKTMNIPVRIIRLGVKDSLDVTAYQRLKTKSQFIDSIMRSKYSLLNNQEGRTIEEDEEGLYDNPVAVLSGSQYAMLKSQAEREYRKWYAKKKQYEQDQIYINSQTKRNKLDIQAAEKRISNNEKRLQILNDTFKGVFPTDIVVDGVSANGEDNLKNALRAASKKVLDAQKDFLAERTYNNEETRAIDVPISLDGLLFTAHIAMRKTSDFKNGKRVTMVKRTLSYSSIPLSIENEPVANNTVDLAKVFDEILTKEITGEYAKERIQNAQNLIDRKQKDNEEMAKRFGKPFEYDEQLAAAKAKVEEYTEKMREEMAEKEERYKQTASNFNLEKAIDREVNSDDDDESEAQYAEMDYDEENLRAEQQVALDAVMTALGNAGVEVEQVSEEAARAEFEKGTTTYKSSDTIYGYAKGGKICLTPKGMNPNTPIHEYAHLWAKAMQHNNPQGWKSVVEQLKGTPMWEEVENDPRYQSLSGEDAIASEVLARYSGKRGAERMEKMAKQMLDNAETRSEVAKSVSLIQRAKKALQDFWKWVGKNLFDIKQFSSADEVADRVLYDLLNGTDIKQQSDNNVVRLMPQIMGQGTLGQSYHPIAAAKLQKNLQTAKENYKKLANTVKNAVEDISKAIGARNTGTSNYVTIEAKNGKIFTLRISNHNATVSNFDNNGEENGISIVISRHDNNGITNNGNAHVVEFFYPQIALARSEGTPIADIIGALEQMMYSGEYKDPTGLAQVQEVNIPADTQAEYSRIRPDETLGEYAHRIAEAKRKERENEKAEFSIQPNETLGEYAHRVAQAHQQKKLETAFKKAQLAATISPHDALPAQQKADAIADYLSFTFGDEYPLQVLPTTDKIAEQLQALGIEEERAKKIETFLAYKNRARGTMIDGTIFAFANRIGSISDAKDVYIHERQHVDNEEYDLPEQLMQDISPEDAVSLLRMLKPNAHRAYADMYLGKGRMGHRMLLDELIAYAVSESMQFAPNTPVQYLQARGITNQQLLNIINNECRRHRFGQSDPRATKSIGRVRTQGERGRGTSPDMRTSHIIGWNEDNRNQPPLNISDAPTPDADETRGDYVARFNMWYNAQRSADAEYDYVQAMQEARRKTERALQVVADRYRPLQKFQEYILSQGGTIRRSEQDADGNLIRTSADAYQDTTLATGRAGYQIQRFASHQLKDMVDAVAAIINSHKLDDIDIRWNNVDTYFTDKKNAKNGKQLTARELVGIYAQAKDCQEAIEQELPDRGKDGFLRNLQDVNGNPVSHTEVIRLVEGALEQEQINNLWQSINAATQFSLDYQLRNGMIDQATYDQFHRNYYVPERGWRERDLDGREDGYTEGRGTQLNGNPYNAALKKARGRDSIASDPFAYIQSIAETTILSTERNNVKQKFLQMLLDNEEIGMKSGAWKIRRAYVVRVTDSNGEAHEVVTYERPKDESTIVTSVVPETMIAQRTRDERLQHRVAVMRDGQQYIIELQDEALANALNSNFKEAQWLSNSFANVMRKGVRYMSAINTQYNPAFAIWNLARDLQIGIVNNAAKESGAFQARFLKNIAAVQPVIMQYVWNDHMKGDENFGKNEELSRYLQEYFESGAQTGFSYMQDVQTLSKEFDKLVKGDSKAKRALEATTDFMSMATELSELTVRFAEFATARQMGFTTEEAAAKAKEISVNFDRKGLLGGTFSGLYSFFNATIQGTWNILRGLKTKRAWIAYLSIAGVYAALGVINTLLNPDDPDDDIFFSDYDRQTNFLIGKIKLPVTHFFRMFFAAGVNITLMGQGKKTGKQTDYDIVNFVLDEIVPASVLQFHNLADYNEATNQIEFAPEKYAQAIYPSYISPFTDVMLNRDFKGATVHREPFITADKDKFKRVSMEKRNTPEIYHDIAYGLHRLSGGNPDVKTKGGSDGLIDINANDLQHIVEGYAGGTGKFVGDLVSLAIGAAQGEFDVSNVPVVNRAFRPYQQERAYTQQYWLLKNRVDHYNALLKDTRENDPEEYRQMINSDLYDVYRSSRNAVSNSRKPQDDKNYTADQVKDLMKLNVQWNKAQ